MTPYDRRQIAAKLEEARGTASALRDAVIALRSFVYGLEWHTDDFPVIGWDARNILETLKDWSDFKLQPYLDNVEQSLKDNVL